MQALYAEGIAFVIVTYGLITRTSSVSEKLFSSKFKVVVADESHYIKNKDAQRTKACLTLTLTLLSS